MDCIAIQSPCPRHRTLGVRGALGWACAGVGGQQAQAWALGRARGARTGRRWACRGVRSVGRAAGRRAGRRWAQAIGAGAHGERHGVGRAEHRQADARGPRLGVAAGVGRARLGRWVRGLCAQAGPVGCSCTRLGFQPGFFDSVFFLSHQMYTVHCKINFEKKNLKFN